jgi:cyclase
MTAIRMTLVGVLVLGLVSTRAQEAGKLSFNLKPIGKNVWAAIDARTTTAPAAANAGVIVGDDGVVVVDTFATAAAAAQLLAEIRKLTPLPVKFVVNTHYHLDHVAGNKVFADAGALVMAHHHVRGWIHPENLKFFGTDAKPEQKAMVEAIMPPAASYDQSVDLHLGRRAVRVQSFPGHTGGDSVVLVPDAKVAFLGDLFWRQTSPNMIDATSAAWMATLESLARNVDYTFIPGHGEIGTATDVAAFRAYIATLRLLVTEARARGQSGEALSTAVLPAMTAKYGSWDFFKFLAPNNIREMEAELSGTKRIPQPPPVR